MTTLDRLHGAARKLGAAPRMVALATSLVLFSSDVDLHAASPPGHFTIPGDGTVYDTMTGLLWERDPPSDRMDSAAGQAYCEGLLLAGRSWRIPSVNELLTIFDPSASNGLKIDTQVFQATQDWLYQTWPLSGELWWVDFTNGDTSLSGPLQLTNVRCVAVDEGR